MKDLTGPQILKALAKYLNTDWRTLEKVLLDLLKKEGK